MLIIKLVWGEVILFQLELEWWSCNDVYNKQQSHFQWLSIMDGVDFIDILCIDWGWFLQVSPTPPRNQLSFCHIFSELLWNFLMAVWSVDNFFVPSSEESAFDHHLWIYGLHFNHRRFWRFITIAIFNDSYRHQIFTHDVCLNP